MQELSLNILDIAQNSVKAGAAHVQIAVEEEPLADRLTVTVTDDGKGMDEATVKRVTDPFYTTRTTRKVGLGIPFFKMAAEMTGGRFSIRSAPGEGTTVQAVFGYSHIDRMPLGDIAGTISALMCLNEAIDFTYTHRIGERTFTASTAEFKAALGPVPMSVPQVMQFVREYLEEHITDLNGGSLDEKLS